MNFEYGAFWRDLIEDLADPEFREAYIDMSLRFQQEFHEEKLAEEKTLEHYGKLHDTWSDFTGRQFYVHKRTVDCDINGCAIHNPSYHPLSDAKQYMRADKGFLIERICSHGIGHPDPDSASFMAKNGYGMGIWVHGCDGCCRDTEDCGAWDGCTLPKGHNMGEADIPENHQGNIRSTSDIRSAGGWGPHRHRYVWGDDGIGNSGSFCECGMEEPDTY